MPVRRFPRVSYFWVVIGLVISVLLIKPAVGTLAANIGMLQFGHARMQEQDRLAPGIYPLRPAKPEGAAYQNAEAWLQFASRIHSSATIGWELTRLGLVSGRPALALTGVTQMRDQVSHIPLAYEDALLALSLNAQYQEIVDLYERETPQLRTAVLSDTVALAYLEQARPFLETSDEIAARPILEKVIRLRPFDLYANAQLYQIARNADDVVAGSAYSQTLTHFLGSSVHPTDERLIWYAIQAIPVLQAEGIWDYGLADRALATLIWLYPASPGLESLVLEQPRLRPDDSNAWFNLAELYQRRGNSPQAEANYRQVLEVDPEYSDAYWRLGWLCEQRSDQCTAHQALDWYMKYLMRRPDDLSVSRRAKSLCEKTDLSRSLAADCKRMSEIVSPATVYGTSSGAALDRWLDDQLDAQAALAQLLNISTTDLALAPEILLNTGFESAAPGYLPGWRLSDEIDQTASYRSHIFIGGLDAIDAWNGQAVLRLRGLWREPLSAYMAPSWYGLWAWDEPGHQSKIIPSDPNQWHFISLFYRTTSATDAVYLHLNQATQLALPATNGAWHYYLVAHCNASSATEVLNPFIYLSVAGDEVSVTDVAVRPLAFSTVTRQPECSESPLIFTPRVTS